MNRCSRRQKRFQHIRSGVAVVTVTLVFCAFAAAQTAVITNVKGSVTRWGDDNVDQKYTARANDRLKDNDWLNTGQRSETTIRPHEMDQVEVKELTTLQVKELARMGESGRVTELELGLGEILCKVRKFRSDEDRFEVRTPTATAAVRGTRFSVRYDVPQDATPGAGITTIRVLEGLVEVTVARTEESLSLGAGDEMSIDALGQAAAPAGPAESAAEAGTSLLDAVDDAADSVEGDISGAATMEAEQIQTLEPARSGDDDDDPF